MGRVKAWAVAQLLNGSCGIADESGCWWSSWGDCLTFHGVKSNKEISMSSDPPTLLGRSTIGLEVGFKGQWAHNTCLGPHTA
eukprot:8904646-Ditylum_brightwellii.AAC.1